ncbi:RNB domain-containing ribonuclease, partial [Streptomyces sp. NPDC058171]
MTSATTRTTSTLLMIDAGTARDRDDAFTITPLPHGSGWAVEVHIAAVADPVTAGSVADEQAFLRASTRYLPNRTIPMLGESAEQAATLTTDNPRTTLPPHHPPDHRHHHPRRPPHRRGCRSRTHTRRPMRTRRPRPGPRHPHQPRPPPTP